MKKIVFALLVLSGMSVAGMLESMDDACQRNVAEACYGLGSLYQGNDGIPADKEKVDQYLTKACNLGHDKSCEKIKKINIKEVNTNNE